MIQSKLLMDEGVLVIRPQTPLAEEDFQTISAIVDPYIEQHGKLNGILIEAKEFPGWKDFASFTRHMEFIRDHHRKVGKIAAVSDSGFLSIAPEIANHFVSAEVKHFAASDYDAALTWLKA